MSDRPDLAEDAALLELADELRQVSERIRSLLPDLDAATRAGLSCDDQHRRVLLVIAAGNVSAAAVQLRRVALGAAARASVK